LDNEEVAVRSGCSTSEVEVFEPYSGVSVLGVFGDVRQRMEPSQKWGLPDPLRERLWAASVRARATPNVLDPGVLTVVVWVTIAIMLLVFVCHAWLVASGALNRAGVAVLDEATVRKGKALARALLRFHWAIILSAHDAL
jgi:hypothetical protein